MKVSIESLSKFIGFIPVERQWFIETFDEKASVYEMAFFDVLIKDIRSSIVLKDFDRERFLVVFAAWYLMNRTRYTWRHFVNWIRTYYKAGRLGYEVLRQWRVSLLNVVQLESTSNTVVSPN